MKALATVRLRLTSAKQAEALAKALQPEVERHLAGRSKIKLVRDFEFLVLTVEAKDTVALRAALNAYLRWINSTVNVLDTIETIS